MAILKHGLFALAVLMLGAEPAIAQQMQGSFAAGPYSYTPLSPGQYTPVSDASATGLTAPANAIYAVVCAEGANHRYTLDGTTTPTASVGMQLLQNACITLPGAAEIAAFKIIYVSSGGTFTASYAK